MSEIPAASVSSVDSSPAAGFRELGLHAAVLQALAEVGYEVPTPIQAATIPALLAGSDLLGQAQTGTGKTAAFALPVLSRIDLTHARTQALVLVPTRELALQVADAFQSYASHLKSFHVLPVYGGQSYTPQMKGLKRGAHVVVGTPGRIMDHMKRGTLDLAALSVLVLDEADEMLQMGFIDDIEWILEQTPKERQVALFSATLPAAIRRIAQRHLRSPVEITIQSKTSTAANIRQRYWLVSGVHKLDALTRILEAEVFDGMLIFVRTKLETVDLAERLQARGFDAAPLNGDIPQQQRERTVNALKAGDVDIVVATDVAARGLDVERISHVVNYDIPYDSESYIHRIGRTGRAGRKGEAILFVAPRERNMLRIIEKATRQRISPMDLPSIAAVNEQRVARFKQRLGAAVTAGEGAVFRELIEEFEREQNVSAVDIAAALASLLQGGAPLLLPEKAEEHPASRAPRSEADGDRRRGREERESRARVRGELDTSGRRHRDSTDRAEQHRRSELDTGQRHQGSAERGEHRGRDRDPFAGGPSDRAKREHVGQGSTEAPAGRKRRRDDAGDVTYERYRVEVGHVHGVKPGNIVGAIANEAGLEGRYIGQVDIREDHSFIDLPEGMPKEIFRSLKKVRVVGRELRIARARS